MIVILFFFKNLYKDFFSKMETNAIQFFLNFIIHIQLLFCSTYKEILWLFVLYAIRYTVLRMLFWIDHVNVDVCFVVFLFEIYILFYINPLPLGSTSWHHDTIEKIILRSYCAKLRICSSGANALFNTLTSIFQCLEIYLFTG